MIKIKRCKRKVKRKTKNIRKHKLDRILYYLFPGNGARKRGLLTVDCHIKVRLDLQANKSSVVVKGPFFLKCEPKVSNPWNNV
jgi:hypothetical protein